MDQHVRKARARRVASPEFLRRVKGRASIRHFVLHPEKAYLRILFTA